jgi:hypothetical protein
MSPKTPRGPAITVESFAKYRRKQKRIRSVQIGFRNVKTWDRAPFKQVQDTGRLIDEREVWKIGGKALGRD